MSKLFRRMTKKKITCCVWLSDFQVFFPASSVLDTYADVKLELKRGKAVKSLEPSP